MQVHAGLLVAVADCNGVGSTKALVDEAEEGAFIRLRDPHGSFA